MILRALLIITDEDDRIPRDAILAANIAAARALAAKALPAERAVRWVEVKPFSAATPVLTTLH